MIRQKDGWIDRQIKTDEQKEEREREGMINRSKCKGIVNLGKRYTLWQLFCHLNHIKSKNYKNYTLKDVY